MADLKFSAATDGVTAEATDRLGAARSPFGAGTSRYITPAYLATFLGFSAGKLTVAAGGTGLSTIAALSTWVANSLDTPIAIAPGAGNSIRVNAGGTAWEAFTPAAGSGATLDGITAATADQAGIANADWNVRWNWAKTTNSEVAFEIGESAASTNGTSTSGVPNQVIAKFSTLAASTASAASFYSRGSFVAAISPTTAQILATAGSQSAPAYSFSGNLGSGMYQISGVVYFSSFGNIVFSMGSNNAITGVSGNASTPGLGVGIATDGVFGLGGGAGGGIGITGGSVENSRFFSGSMRASKGTADAVSYALNFLKSRGTVAAPTVITTGDDLATISGFGYVGGTNTYQEACRITFDSTGVISDSATGIGGIIKFWHATVGAEPVTVAQMKSQHIVHSGTPPTITAGGGTDPTIAGTDEAFVVTVGTGGLALSVEVTFGNAFTTNPPVVIPVSDTDIVPYKVVVTTTKVTITAALAFTAGSKLECITRGWE